MSCRFVLSLLTVVTIGALLGFGDRNGRNSDFHQRALNNSKEPIRPGKPGVSPFWNKYAKQFQFAPAFDFEEVKGASSYRFSVRSEVTNERYQFTAGAPWNPLSPIWKDLPVGYADLRVEGLNRNGESIGVAGKKTIYRAPVFPGINLEDTSNYRKPAKRLLKALFDLDHIQHWAETGTPDHEAYARYSYPSKMAGAVIWSMLNYSRVFSTKDDRALRIAERAANYLIEESTPRGTPMAFFPPTYEGDAHAADEYGGQIMMVYPAEVGMRYLDLYEATKDNKYLDAAIRIAETYKKNQLSNGTWYLKVYTDSGKPVRENYLIPGRILVFLDRLISDYKRYEYREVSKRALRWTMENPVQTFNWSGQFEDISEPSPYKNLSHIEPSWIVLHLLNNLEGNREKYIEISRQLLRFCEDQFVIWGWNFPYNVKRKLPDDFAPSTWIIPAALEQYNFYVPITTSACRIIRGWRKMYKVTGNEMYLAKAILLSNSMLEAQNKKSGHVSTYWSRERVKDPTSNYWLNNSAFFAESLLRTSRLLRHSDI